MSEQYQVVGKGLRFVFFGEVVAIIALFLSRLSIIGAILSALAQVLVLVGLYTAGKANPGLRTAFLVAMVNLVVAVITIFLPFATALSTLLKAVEVYFICSRTAELLTEKENKRLASRGQKLWKVYVGCVVVAMACMALSQVPVLGLIAAVVIAVAAVVMVVAYIIYLMFLFQSQEALLQ